MSILAEVGGRALLAKPIPPPNVREVLSPRDIAATRRTDRTNFADKPLAVVASSMISNKLARALNPLLPTNSNHPAPIIISIHPATQAESVVAARASDAVAEGGEGALPHDIAISLTFVKTALEAVRLGRPPELPDSVRPDAGVSAGGHHLPTGHNENWKVIPTAQFVGEPPIKLLEMRA